MEQKETKDNGIARKYTEEMNWTQIETKWEGNEDKNGNEYEMEM